MKRNVTSIKREESLLQQTHFVCVLFQIPKLTYLRPGAMKLDSQDTEQTSYTRV